MDDEQWQQWLEGFKNGESLAVQQFCNHYGPLLQRVAANRLADRMRRRLDPEDVVQSVCRTFVRRVQSGQLELTDSETLWRLLCAITLTKVREQVRYHSRRKRGVSHEVAQSSFNFTAPGPSPEEAAAFADQLEQLLQTLDEEERQIVDLKLQDCTHEEVAERMGVSERTVRRLFKRVQNKLARVIEAS